MRAFDHDYVVELIARLNRLKPDVPPGAGGFSVPELIGHLVNTVRLTTGKRPAESFRGSWFTVHVMGPVALRGLLPIWLNGSEPLLVSRDRTADTETLHAELEDYLALVQAGALHPPAHPVYGDIGIDGWARFHALHFEHHLKQLAV